MGSGDLAMLPSLGLLGSEFTPSLHLEESVVDFICLLEVVALDEAETLQVKN